MLKMAMIVYNEAVNDEVMDILGRCGLKNHTKITGVFGQGLTSGVHMGDDIWPGRNNILYVACEDKQAQQLLSCINEIRKELGREGIKAFLFPLEELT
ncbi:MAG: PG0541 family transporter-associated protein [Candidatus Omnitrophota bacterium]